MSSELSETKRKISHFENSEKEKAEKEARDRKKALFARKLSKFGESVDEVSNKNNNNNNNGEVGAKVKLFTEAPGAEERQREAGDIKMYSSFSKIAHFVKHCSIFHTLENSARVAAGSG